MPGLDGTGPTGMGPMTGWGRGLCNSYSYSSAGRRFRGFSPWWAHGRGFGWGRGRGWRHQYWATGLPGWARGYPEPAYGPWEPPYAPPEAYYGAPFSREEEMDMLRAQAAAQKEELDGVEERISGLEAQQKTEE